MFFVGSSFRRMLNTEVKRFPWHYYVRLVYNDALTYNPATGTGGVKASWKFRQFARSPQNMDLQAYAIRLVEMKNNEELPFDKLSYSDYAVAAAFTTITAAQGPVMLDQFFYGRKDALLESECGPVPLTLPKGGDFVSHLQSLNFSEEEIVALASIDAFGVIEDPEHSRWSNFAKLDNYYYK